MKKSGTRNDMAKDNSTGAEIEKAKAVAKTEGDEKTEKSKGKKEHVRKKAWRPKTKTGCQTCR